MNVAQASRPSYLASLLLLLLTTNAFSEKPNVLLLSIDTLRSDHLGCYGSKTKTPSIDAFAATSVLFENTISQVPLTLPSHCTILTGLYPDQHGVRNNENFVLPARVKTLAEMFQENGYATGGFVGSFSLDSTFGIQQGFQVYDDRIGNGHDPELNRNVERRAETVWKLGRSWIETQHTPWFAFVHFFDPHFPYNPPSPYPQTYDGEIGYVDHIVGQILDFLKRRPTTIVILLSDHGESLGEHGEDNHGIFLYDATLKVPLMIHAPGIAARRVKEQVRLVDVTPTIAEIAGLPRPAGLSGRSLGVFMKGEGQDLPAYSETYYSNLLMGWAPLRSIRWSNKKWIDAPKPELYDLARDPGEIKNIYTPSSIPTPIRGELSKHNASVQASLKDVDPETREKLASLGYVTGGSASSISSGFDPKDGVTIWHEIESAVRFAQLEKWQQSETGFRKALAQQPDNVIANKFLANVLKKQGKYQQAIPLLQKALKSNLHQNETRNELAEAYSGNKQYQEALDQTMAVIKRAPKDLRALTMTAWLQSRLNMDDQAIATYAKISDLRGLTEEEALDAAGISLTDRKVDAAEKYFQDALNVNPDSKAAWKGLGLIAASKQQWDTALDAFLKAGDCNDAKGIASNTANQSLLTRLHKQCP